MTSHFKIACGAVAVVSLVTVTAIGRSPSATVPPPPNMEGYIVPRPTELQIVQARKELAAAMQIFYEAPKIVQVEPIKPTPPPSQDTLKLENRTLTPPPVQANEPKKTEKPKYRPTCRKIWKQGKEYWRCRK